jgi:hypothetical protein
MIQDFNRNRVLIEVIPELNRIITFQTRKKRKIINGRIRLVGSQVEAIKPGQIVAFYNEGINVTEGRVLFRIVNEIAVVAVQNDEPTKATNPQKETDQESAGTKDHTETN